MSNETTSIPMFVSGHSKAQWIIIFLTISILLGVVSIFSTSFEISLLTKVMNGQRITEAEAASNDSRQQIIGILQVIAFVAIAILFLMWVHRAHKNLPALGARNLKYTPGWAVGGFFVPFLNLYRPYQVIKEIFKESDFEKPYTSTLIKWWWALSLIDGFISQASFRMTMRGKTINDLYAGSWISLISDAIGIISAILTISVVKEIDKRQEDRFRVTENKSNTPYILSQMNEPKPKIGVGPD